MNTLQLYGTVGTEITIDLVRNFLNANKNKDVNFEISTLGGDVVTAFGIYDLIKAHNGNTHGDIKGLTASAGTVIASACDKTTMSDNALYLIHNGWTEKTGNVFDLQKTIADLSKTDALMVKIYREKTSLPDAKIKELMKASDWLTPEEALNYGFVNSIKQTETKIAASVLISEAQGKIDNLLLTKLKNKMNFFGKKEGEKQYPLTFADGNICVINAEEAATGVAVAPLGAMQLEDGTFELADGRKITVAGGVITEVTEMEPEAPEAAATEEIVGVVAEMFLKQEAKTKAMVEEMLKPFQAMAGSHTPPKGPGPINTGNAFAADDLQSKIEAKQAQLKADVETKRKGK